MSKVKIAGIVIAILVIPFLLASMDIFGWGFFQRSTANFRGQTQAIEQTRANADFRLNSYNHFFDLCSAIQGDEASIKAQTDLLASAGESDRFRVQTNIAALSASREQKIRQYNVDATKSFTTGQFRDSKLPYQLQIQGETTCVINY